MKITKLTVPMHPVLLDRIKRDARSQDRSAAYVARAILAAHYGQQEVSNVDQSHGDQRDADHRV